MFIYLLALPVWSFILPVYAYWHFDDFSWGETRKVEGESKGDDHGKKEGKFDASKIPLKRWEDWERGRIRHKKRENQRQMKMNNSPTSPNHVVDDSYEAISDISSEVGQQQYYDYRSQYNQSQNSQYSQSQNAQYNQSQNDQYYYPE